ncbi:MAG: hypothetical protein M1818_004152 [Claussenomyces sp. TS43310]|nr:MAG: hypothetical protein M1818_004152 [Claussenomyces sp. TS43310]
MQARNAQEALAQLEKNNASIEEQLEQAALFAGVAFQELKTNPPTIESRQGSLHGREDWTLKWLLKKLSTNKDARGSPEAWTLAKLMAHRIPVRNAARVMNERKFMTTVREALDETLSSFDTPAAEGWVREDAKPSKKRKRGDGAVAKARNVSVRSGELQSAIHGALESIVRLSTSDETFEAEYMRSTLRTSAEEAARVLGSWLALCTRTKDPTSSSEGSRDHQLDTFLEIWRSRAIGSDDSTFFSKHCLTSLLTLLSSNNSSALWRLPLEEVLARNIVVPAKTAYSSTNSTDVLRMLVGEAVSQTPNFGPILLDIAARCLQPRGDRRRKPHDTSWLQSVFLMIENAMVSTSKGRFDQALVRLLQICAQHQVALDLPILRRIMLDHAFLDSETDWDIILTIVKLDSNAFVMEESGTEDLLELLFSRITDTSLSPSWPQLATKIVDNVLAPLMDAFARVRDLIAFIRRWHAQLVDYEQRRTKINQIPETFSAWEDDALCIKLKEIMEASLTTGQVIELVDWLQSESKVHKQTFLVIADAVAGAVTKEDTIDALGVRLCQIVLEADNNLNERYRFRPSRIASSSLSWCSSSHIVLVMDTLLDYLSLLLGQGNSHAIRYGDLTHLEASRCLLRAWARLSSDGRQKEVGGMSISSWVQHEQHQILNYATRDLMSLKGEEDLGDQSVGSRVSSTRSKAWFSCEYLSSILVENPESFKLHLNGPKGGDLLDRIIWAASATTPWSAEHSPNAWLRHNFNVLPNLWQTMCQSDDLLNDPIATEIVIEAMLKCATHNGNPIEPSRACNGFIILSLLRMPIEAFSRRVREQILKSWPAESPDPALDETEAMAYRMAPLDPAVLSLKVKVMQRPTLYEGINFQELLDLGESIAVLGSEPRTLLPIFAEFARLTLSHVLATIDQHKSRDYLQAVFDTLEKWIQQNVRAKNPPAFTMIGLVKVISSVVATKTASLKSSKILDDERYTSMSLLFKEMLLNNLSRLLQKPSKLRKFDGERSMSLYSTVDALRALHLEKEDIETLSETLREVPLDALQETNVEIGRIVKTYLFEQIPSIVQGASATDSLGGDVFSDVGRQAVQSKTSTLSKSLEEDERLVLATDLLREGLADKGNLDKLLALKDVILTCEDSRGSPHETGGTGGASLPSLYDLLTSNLWKAKGFRQFCFIGEIMEMMLRTKARSITQYSIDCTLSSISMVCSRGGPSLPARRAGTIYLHLCHLLQAVLLFHRLKLQGRSHLVVQVMQSLLRCLFVPVALSHTAKSALPTWLLDQSSKSRLSSAHAVAYTRLLTLICDPSVSSVSRSSTNNLNSATAKAKRLAGQHMPFVLSSYIRLQLDMGLKMSPDIRERLVPGIYAIFDTTTLEGRRVLGESMDVSGRAVLGNLVRDWQRFGKWKGS